MAAVGAVPVLDGGLCMIVCGAHTLHTLHIRDIGWTSLCRLGYMPVWPPLVPLPLHAPHLLKHHSKSLLATHFCPHSRPHFWRSLPHRAVRARLAARHPDLKPLVILHVGRTKAPQAREPAAAALLEELRAANQLFVSPAGSNDDW